MADVVLHAKDVRRDVMALRSRFVELQYCFTSEQLGLRLEELRSLL